eukprot:jgi/Galph1/754/GphlegSOOS_G5516.1
MASILSSCGARIGRSAFRVAPRTNARSPSPSRTCMVPGTSFPRSTSLDEGLLLYSAKEGKLGKCQPNNCYKSNSGLSFSSPTICRSQSFEGGLKLSHDWRNSQTCSSSIATAEDACESFTVECRLEPKDTNENPKCSNHLPPRNRSNSDAVKLNDKEQKDWRRELASLIAKGEMIPDTQICSLVRDNLLSAQVLKKNGWLLDGFPRTVVQAEELLSGMCEYSDLLKPSAMIVLDVSDMELIDRMIYRRLDPVTGKIYNLKTRAPTEPQIMQRLVQREDDREDVVLRRIAVYKKTACHIESIFETFGVPVIHIDASSMRNCEAVFLEIQTILENIHRQQENSSCKLVLAGPPGCGKGTQAELLSKRYDLYHLSTGNILRDIVKEKNAEESFSTDLRSVGVVFGRQDSRFSRMSPVSKSVCLHETSFAISALPLAASPKIMSAKVG